MHAMIGNGNGAKGQSKGRGKSIMEVDPEMQYARAVRNALPEAARVRMQSKLLQEEWDVPVRNWQDTGPPDRWRWWRKTVYYRCSMLEKVGYTAQPSAVLVTQDPDALILRGYPRTQVMCSLDVDAGAGKRSIVIVERFLVGFAGQVSMVRVGSEVDVGVTMTKMVARFSTLRGWAPGPLDGPSEPSSVVERHRRWKVTGIPMSARVEGFIVCWCP